MIGHVVSQTLYRYKLDPIHYRHWKMPCGHSLRWEVDHGHMSLGGFSKMAWNSIFIILSVRSSLLFYSFLKNNRSLFKNTVMIMIEKVDNIFPNIIWMHWMNRTVGDHFPKILIELDVRMASLYTYFCIFISIRILKNIEYTIVGKYMLIGFQEPEEKWVNRSKSISASIR